MKTKETKKRKLEELYRQYFTTLGIVKPADNSKSLQQPSIYKSVETFTTCGSLEYPFNCSEIKKNA